MGYKLAIAEKPSVAKAIADVLGAKSKKDGYYEGSGYLVSWCVGHLLGHAMPEAYDEKLAKWRLEDLPILPSVWKYTAADSTKKQLKVLKDLMNRSDVDAVINACDAGREGELILRLVYEYCKCSKVLKRLWVSSMEESAIKDGFNNLRTGSDFDGLYRAALCRSQADWLVGLNYSRTYSCLYNANLSIGRVQTPTLAMIVEREHKIRDFVKEPHYTVEITGNVPGDTSSGTAGRSFTAVGKKLQDKGKADSISAACDGKPAVVKSVEQFGKTESAPKLYDLTTLQREANKMFGYTAKQTLEVAQKLYEIKVLTYPRTDSRYITEDMAGGIAALVTAVTVLLPFAVDFDRDIGSINTAHIVNNAKVTDHFAIIPTPTAPSFDMSALSTAERNILLMVCTRLLAAVAQKYVYAETVITVDCEGEIFIAKGKTVKQKGWKAIEKAFAASCGKTNAGGKGNNEDNCLPQLTQGQQFTVKSSVREGFTQPPKHYTEDTILAAMENAGAEDMPEDVERKGIGTPATRADTLETLVKREYIVRMDKHLIPTEKGFNLIKVLPDHDSIKSPILTAEWESDLKKVEREEMTADAFMEAISRYVGDTVANNKAAGASEEYKDLFPSSRRQGGKSSGEIVGKCVRCGCDVIENPKAFSCVNTKDKKCGFVLFKDNKYFNLKKKTVTKAIAKALLTDGRVFIKDLHSDKTGKTYAATIFLDDKGEGYVGFRMEFEQKSGKK